MRRIFSKLLYEIEEERNTMLVTVIADRGSAPRGAGALALIAAASSGSSAARKTTFSVFFFIQNPSRIHRMPEGILRVLLIFPSAPASADPAPLPRGQRRA